VDLLTGATERLAANAKAWCERVITYKLSDSTYYHGGSGGYVGQLAVFPCTASGASSPIPVTIPSFVRQTGASADGVTAWTEARGVYAEPN
jgi:hypothetical protein